MKKSFFFAIATTAVCSFVLLTGFKQAPTDQANLDLDLGVQELTVEHFDEVMNPQTKTIQVARGGKYDCRYPNVCCLYIRYGPNKGKCVECRSSQWHCVWL